MTKKRDKVKYLNCIQKGLLLIILSISFIPIVTAGNYTGNSSTCKTCHEAQYALWTNSTHTSKLITRDDAIARGYPNPPGGYSWENVSFAIGGKWKIRYVNDTGYIITTGGKNQFNVDDQIWTDYNKDTSKPYICGNCHNTGYISNVTDIVKEPFRTLRAQGKIPDGIYNNSLTPGFTGYWAENSIGCEACHGQGGDHVNNPTKLNIRNASEVRNSPGICGNCHSRPNTGEYEDFKPYPYGVNDTLLNNTLYDSSPMPTFDYSKVGGHHEQWEDWKASVHANKSVNCVTCHGGHSVSDPAYAGGPTGKTKFTNGTVYPAAVNKTCTDCHSITPAKHGYYTKNSECISCHMPINRKSANKMDLRSHWFNVSALKDNKNGDPHATANFYTLQTVNESCTTCHNSANLSKPIDTTRAGVHKDINKSEGIGLLNSSDCKSCHYDASASSILSRNCDACHIDQVITSPKVNEHTDRSTDVAVTASCALCHNNSINKFKYSNNASVSHYGTVNSLINTSNCIDCHNGAYTGNASWGSPVNISTSTKRQHTETQTSQCDQCHNDGKVQTLAAVTFHNASVETAPMNQNLGLQDTQMPNVSVALCQGCHQGAPDIHHYMVSGGPGSNMTKTTALGCADCHPIVGGQLTISRNCHDCHDGIAWTVNPNINLSVIRGASGRPHHNTTKRSASSTFNATFKAINRQCTFCHGDGYLDNYNDNHSVPTYNTSMVTPLADFKINTTIGNGREWGGCAACHDAGVEGAIVINSNQDTHHYETTSMLGRQCNYCHVSFGARAEPIPDISSDPSANPLRVWLNESYPSYTSMFKWDTSMRHGELRNNTIMTLQNDPINGTGCEKCHSVRDLHNIETASPGLNLSETLRLEIPGYGHIGNNSDCNGCHQGWAGSVENPFPGPKAMSIGSVAPGVLTADVATDVTITGSNFVEDPYTTTVLVDGVSTAPTSITETSIVVNVNLAAGAHTIVIQKDVATTPLTTVMAVAPGTISSAKLSGTTLTIDGAGLGADQTMVVIVKSDGTRVASESITSSTDTQVVAEASQAAVGDTVEVITPTGKATATITEASVPDSLTVTAPNGGENWKRGTTQTITWGTAGTSQAANVKIELLKGTSVNRVIASSTPNDGSYSWTIPGNQATATNYKIRITSVGHTPSYTDSSDGNFQISR